MQSKSTTFPQTRGYLINCHLGRLGNWAHGPTAPLTTMVLFVGSRNVIMMLYTSNSQLGSIVIPMETRANVEAPRDTSRVFGEIPLPPTHWSQDNLLMNFWGWPCMESINWCIATCEQVDEATPPSLKFMMPSCPACGLPWSIWLTNMGKDGRLNGVWVCSSIFLCNLCHHLHPKVEKTICRK